MDGILLVDKPQGWTSHDVVAKTRGILRRYYDEHPELCACSQCKEAAKHAPSGTKAVPRGSTGANDVAMAQESFRRRSAVPTGRKRRHKVQVGHAGTLDPMAEGLLILLIGKATKQQARFMKLDKTYKATITLGAESDTDDAEGTIRDKGEGIRVKPDNQAIEAVLKEFTGEIDQVPPAYSAIKVDGQRAYRQARAGKAPVLKPRQVKIYSIELMAYKYPEVKIKAEVSSGTYIRSLARDVGQTLGTGGYLSRLLRTRVGPYLRQNSIQITKLDAAALEKSIIAVH